MGNKINKETEKCKTYNSKYAKKPLAKKKYENIVYDYLYNNHRMITQEELYDFALVDYNIYIEIDEEQHLSSGNSVKKAEQTRRDHEKICKCLSKPATLVRISWFSIKNGEYIDIIEYCVKNKNTIENKLVLSSKEIYNKLDMLNGINHKSIIFYK